MKGVSFYEEFANKRKGVSEGNCVAVLVERCKRVSEQRAREIHPELFKYLEKTS